MRRISIFAVSSLSRWRYIMFRATYFLASRVSKERDVQVWASRSLVIERFSAMVQSLSVEMFNLERNTKFITI